MLCQLNAFQQIVMLGNVSDVSKVLEKSSMVQTDINFL